MVPPFFKLLSAWLHSVRSWLVLCFYFWIGAAMTTADVFMIVIFAILSPVPLLLQFASWKVSRRYATTPERRLWLAMAVPCISALWLIFYFSYFYGHPREVMKLAFQEPPPFVFTVEEFNEYAWTDYGFTLKVHLDPQYLKHVLDRHFERRDDQRFLPRPDRSGLVMFDRKSLPSLEGTSCTVATTPDFRYAEIQYSSE